MAARNGFYLFWVLMGKKVTILEQMQGHIVKMQLSALVKSVEFKNRFNCSAVVLKRHWFVCCPQFIYVIHRHDSLVYIYFQLSKTRFF